MKHLQKLFIIFIVSGNDTRYLDTARELLKRGISIDIIAESTQLPKEEIEKLAAEIQREQMMH